MTTLALIGGFLLLMAIGVPVAISLAGASLIYVMIEGVQPYLVVVHRMVGGGDFHAHRTRGRGSATGESAGDGR